MKVKIVDIRPYDISGIEVRLQFLDDSLTILGERLVRLPSKSGLTIAAGKALLKSEIDRFKAEQDTFNRFNAFKGQTFDESQL